MAKKKSPSKKSPAKKSVSKSAAKPSRNPLDLLTKEILSKYNAPEKNRLGAMEKQAVKFIAEAIAIRDDRAALEFYMKHLKIMEDATRAVMGGHRTSLYLYGRPGTGKTFTIRKTMLECDPNSIYLSGHVDPEKFFETLAAYPKGYILLDDTTSLFSTKYGKQLATSALGKQDEGMVRKVDRPGHPPCFFSGGVIIISNTHPKKIKEFGAVLSRLFLLTFNPRDSHVRAFIRFLASKGKKGEDRDGKPWKLTPKETMEVCDHYLACCKKHDKEITVRGAMDNSTGMYRAWKLGDVETHWRDMIEIEVSQQEEETKHPPQELITRMDKTDMKCEIALEIFRSFDDKKQRVVEWKKRTVTDEFPEGLAQPTYYRMIAKLRQRGILPPG
jgi:hypothetical protein